MKAISAGARYFSIVFAAGFAFGTVRTLLVVPRLGEVAAVTIEAPLMLGVSWIVAKLCICHLAVPNHGLTRIMMGATAFFLLMLAEAVIGMALFGRPLFTSLTTAAGMTGLASPFAFPAVAEIGDGTRLVVSTGSSERNRAFASENTA